VEFDGENFLAADGVAGKSAVGEAGAFDGTAFLGHGSEHKRGRIQDQTPKKGSVRSSALRNFPG